MESVDYERVIQDLESRRSAFNASIDAAIQAIRSVLAAGVGGPKSDPTLAPSFASGQLTPAALFGKSIPEAVIVCLQAMRKPMTTREIVEALEGASFHHQSQNFGNTVNSILHRRADVTGDVVKIGRTWALSEWYPGRRRQNRAVDDTKVETEASSANGRSEA